MLDNKVALVTGASRGIGKAIALELGNLGATVIGTGTSQESSEKITAFFKEHKINGYGIALDVANPSEIIKVIDQVTEQSGVPTVLINNAGITRDNLMLRMKDDEWNDVINTDLSSVYHVTKACLKGMIKQRWGRIINLTSVVASTGNPGQVNYSAAKAGIIGFTKSLAIEIASRNITVNAIAPGFIETDMTKDIIDAHKERLLASIPMARMGQAEEIAYAVGFLSSNKASYITGQTLHINGGMYNH